MAKAVIFDQFFLGVKGVAEDLKQICEYNENDIYVLSGSDKAFELIPLSETCQDNLCQFKLANNYENNTKTVDDLFNLILDFICHNPGEDVVLMISYKLKAIPFNYQVLAGNLYAKLLIEINKNTNGKIDLSRLSFLIYYFNGLEIISDFCEALKEIYKLLNEEDKKYFPKECLEPQNISLVEGGVANWTWDFMGVNDEYFHLKMPNSYIQYLKSLNQEKRILLP